MKLRSTQLIPGLALFALAVPAQGALVSVGGFYTGSLDPSQDAIFLANYSGPAYGCGTLSVDLPVCNELTLTGTLDVSLYDPVLDVTSNHSVAVAAGAGEQAVFSYAPGLQITSLIWTLTIDTGVLALTGGTTFLANTSVLVSGGLAGGEFSLEGDPVTETPEPSTLWLSAAAGLAILKRRRPLILGGLIMFVAIAGAQTPVNLSPSASPASGQPSVSTLTVTAGGMPPGIAPANIGVSLTPDSGSGPPASTIASAVVAGIGGTQRISFAIPAALTVPASQLYRVQLTGATVTSTNYATFTLLPPAAIVSLSRTSDTLGVSGSTTITGSNTHFSSRSTVSMGPGITVQAIDAPNALSLTVYYQVAGNAAGGARTVAVATGNETVTAVNAFSVLALPGSQLPPSYSISPNSALRGSLINVTITGTNLGFSALTTINAGAGITVSNIVVQNPNSLTARLEVAPGAPAGARTFVVSTPQLPASPITITPSFTVNGAIVSVNFYPSRL